MPKDNNRPGALIAGGHYASLGAARNLGQHGVPVFVVDSEVCITRYSKYIKEFFRCPSEKDDSSFVEFFIQLSSRSDIAGSVLFASTDEQVRIFSQNRQRLSEHYIVPLPEWDITQYLYDKRLTRDLALRRQIPIPETVTVNCVQDISLLELNYPLVLKPAITSHLVAKTKKKAYRANTPEELITLYNQIANIMDPKEIVIQELIPGGPKNLYSYFGYFKEGRPIIGYSAKRLRQHPMEFGKASTFAVSTCIPELEILATRLLTEIGYTGMAEVEFMYNPNHSRFEFLEVNPRIWGWHTLSIAAGVDLPYFVYTNMLGEPCISGQFTEGVKWTHFATDLPTAFIEILHGHLSIRDYFRSIRGSRDAVFCNDDPIPFLMELLLVPYLAIRRGF
jgi:D-aspartate ligase